MTGAPKSGVTALSGMMPRSPGSTHSRLHNNATALPESMVAGTTGNDLKSGATIGRYAAQPIL